MNFKTKAVALLAGSTLALSLATGAMASDGTEILLEDNQVCGASLTGSDVDFGTYEWNGTAYVPVTGNMPATTLEVTVTDPRQTVGLCDFTVDEGNMSFNSDTIDVEYSYNSLTGNPLTVEDVAAGAYDVEVSISSILDNAYDPGTYSGTVEVSAGNAS